MATKQKSQISHAQNIQHTCNIKLHKVLLSTQMKQPTSVTEH